MKKIFLSTISLLFLLSMSAQEVVGKKEDKNPEAPETHNYWGAGTGYYFLPLASLNAHLGSAGFNTKFEDAIGVGIDYGYNTISSKLSRGVTGLLSFHYLLPQYLDKTGNGNTTKLSLNGYNAQFDLVGANFLNSQSATLTGGLGWAFGRLKVSQDENGNKSTYLNKYFAAEGRFEFNVRLAEHFYIGVRYAYRADLTKTRWTRTGSSALDFPGMNMSGTMLGAFIGYGK